MNHFKKAPPKEAGGWNFDGRIIANYGIFLYQDGEGKQGLGRADNKSTQLWHNWFAGQRRFLTTSEEQNVRFLPGGEEGE